jgi:hypothetical protein
MIRGLCKYGGEEEGMFFLRFGLVEDPVAFMREGKV